MNSVFSLRLQQAQKQLGYSNASTASLVNAIKAKAERFKQPTIH